MPDADLLAPRRIVILGGGTAGWMAAAALAHLLGPLRVAITLVESEAIGTVGVGEATIPPITLFNEMIGLDERLFLRETEGTYKLGIEFVDWRRRGHRYMHAFGPIGTSMRGIDFHHFWLRARALGDAHPLGDYSLNEVAAREARFRGPARDQPNSPLSTIAYAYHFDAALYARVLRTRAEELGVSRVEGEVTGAERDGELVAALRLADGRAVAGDLFVDCSGFRGVLIEEAMGAGYDDWRRWLPCDRAVAVPSARTEPLLPYTRATAEPAGWRWRIPLRHRTGNGHVYASDHLPDDRAVDALLAGLDGAPLADPRFLRFTPGRRRRAWVGNVVALGLAAGFLEPLESTSIHLVQTGIQRLVALFPRGAIEPAEVARFNAATAAEYERIRDFLVLHYRATARDDGFWPAVRAMPVPASLEERIALFRANGRIFRADDDLFAEASWVSVLIGQGIVPRGHHPLADQFAPDELLRRMVHVRSVVRASADAMPNHATFLAG